MRRRGGMLFVELRFPDMTGGSASSSAARLSPMWRPRSSWKSSGLRRYATSPTSSGWRRRAVGDPEGRGGARRHYFGRRGGSRCGGRRRRASGM